MGALAEYYLQPGYIYASTEGSLIKTVLGSCVAVCLWDQQRAFGGMNHYMYPRRCQHPPSAKYGDVSILHLIKLMVRLGAEKKDLAAYIAGGAANLLLDSPIGHENVLVAEEVLAAQGIKIIARRIGGSSGKKVIFNTYTGELQIASCLPAGERVR